MKKQFAYFYFMKKEPEKIKSVVPAHAEYWENLNPEKYAGGPFDDRSGGLITFEMASLEDAERAVTNDPFMREELLEQMWLKEWLVQ